MPGSNDKSERKKVLVITFYWPPAGGITVLRCLKLVKYLRNFGWEPVVFTVDNPSYQFIDLNNEKDIPEGLEVIKGKIFDPTELFKRISGRKKKEALVNITNLTDKKHSWIDKIGIWIRGNFFIPDARMLWIKPSVKALGTYLQHHHIDAIFTDGPPHTNTVIGMKLAEKFGIPWLADFQDPWTQVDYYQEMMIGDRAHRTHSRMEQNVFRTARKITIASPTWKRDLESIGAKNVSVFYYGYDEADFAGYEKNSTGIFKIFHGGLLGNDRNPTVLFEAIREIILEQPSWKEHIAIRFAGQVDHAVKRSVEVNGLEANTLYLGQIPREEILENYADSALLLLPINRAANAQGRIPGKLYEYLRAQTPILVFGPDDGDVKAIVESKQLGVSFDYSTPVSVLKDYLLPLMKAFFAGESMSVNADVSEFSNENQTLNIARYLDEIT
ncbi:MAG TPA: hypothetical protein VL098_02865 [Flavipsychrobacter sp.]|nr:hypothetical protein [Flavipsychrobacter sp.]